MHPGSSLVGIHAGPRILFRGGPNWETSMAAVVYRKRANELEHKYATTAKEKRKRKRKRKKGHCAAAVMTMQTSRQEKLWFFFLLVSSAGLEDVTPYVEHTGHDADSPRGKTDTPIPFEMLISRSGRTTGRRKRHCLRLGGLAADGAGMRRLSIARIRPAHAPAGLHLGIGCR